MIFFFLTILALVAVTPIISVVVPKFFLNLGTHQELSFEYRLYYVISNISLNVLFN